GCISYGCNSNREIVGLRGRMAHVGPIASPCLPQRPEANLAPYLLEGRQGTVAASSRWLLQAHPAPLPDIFQFLPSHKKFCKLLPNGRDLRRQLLRSLTVFLVKIRLREKGFDARNFRFALHNLRFHALQFARFLERQL